MTLALAEHPSLSLDSFDRLFPSQDYMPSGGFGNLIALPLQRKARNDGNSLFLDDEFRPIQDQWHFLANMRRLSSFEIDSILAQHLPKYEGLKLEHDEPEVANAEAVIDIVLDSALNEEFDGEIDIVLKSQLSLDINKIPKKLISALRRVATFANPEFFKMQRMRFSTWNTPRYISCCELKENQLVLPRGILDKCIEIFDETGVTTNIIDQRQIVFVRFQRKISDPRIDAIRKESSKNRYLDL